MRRTKLIWQIIPLFALIIFMCMAAFAWFSSRSIKSFYIARFSEKMSDKLRIAVDLMPSGMALSRICSELGEIEGMRITAILADGKVACDTSGEAGQMENHSSRPEFAAALRGEISSGVRLSDTTGEEMLYTAVPVLNEKRDRSSQRGCSSDAYKGIPDIPLLQDSHDGTGDLDGGAFHKHLVCKDDR